jgi:hypothetical protein
MTRDLTRADLRFIITRGLEETAGSYKQLVSLLNMSPNDYKRFLNFLRKHECHVPFARFRSAELRRHRLQDEGFVAAPLLDDSPVLATDMPLPAETAAAGFARR